MYRSLTQEEWEQEEHKAKHSPFMVSLHQKLGPHAEMRDLVELGVGGTPQCDSYEYELKYAEMIPMLDEELEVIPNWGTSM